MNYSDLLKKAREELPKSTLKADRFEVPKVQGHIQGNKTIVSNFNQIAGVLRRDPEHLLKFVLKELAAPGEIVNNGVIIGRKVSAASINEKIDKYVREFVICDSCKKPDTQLLSENKMIFIKCLACGAKQSVKYKL